MSSQDQGKESSVIAEDVKTLHSMGYAQELSRTMHAFSNFAISFWAGAILGILFTPYTPVYSTVVSVTVLFLFISYGMPVIPGVFAWGKRWTRMGPWNLGQNMYNFVALLVALSFCLIFVLGVQPPNDKALYITVGFLVLAGIVWFGVERRRFKGPPQGVRIRNRQQEIRAAEAAVGETGAR